MSFIARFEVKISSIASYAPARLARFPVNNATRVYGVHCLVRHFTGLWKIQTSKMIFLISRASL
jgi:hypothetical protein